ncbi:unnamed protein product [Mortierella alpina]
MTMVHAELYKKQVPHLREIEDLAVIVLGQKLKAVYAADLAARRKAHDWGKAKTVKKSDYILFAQLSIDILDRLQTILSSVVCAELVSIVFYNTIKGDYYHYVAEYLTDHDKRKIVLDQDKALSSFLAAKETAVSSAMSVVDPLYLELHISLVKCYNLMKMYSTARLLHIWAYIASNE